MAKASIKPHGEGACPHAQQAGRAVAPRPPPLVRLGDVCAHVRGVSYKPRDARDEFAAGYVPLLRANNIGENGLNHDEIVYVKRECVKDFQFLHPGDLLVCASSGSRHLVGKAAQILSDEQETFGAFCKVVRPDPQRILPDYLAQYFQSDVYRRTIANKAAGANINNIRSEHIDDLQIPLPPLPEQKRIAAILDKICEMKRNAEASLQKLDLLVKARFVEMFGDARLNDKAWTILNFSNICRVRQGLQIPISDRLAIPEDNCFEYITIAYLHGTKKREYIRNPKPSVVCHKDDVLMTRTGNTGLVVSNVEGVFHNNFFLIDFDKSRFERLFIIHYLNSTFIQGMIQKYAGISTIPDLNHGDFYRMPIFEPPLALQRQFAAFVEKVEGLKATAKKELEQVDLLYRAKLQEFFG